MPKLRTKTGCLTCRKRRKKCDETRDSCQNCSRNSFKCVWPTADQEKDRRHLPRKAPFSDTSSDGGESHTLTVPYRHDSPVGEIFFTDIFSFSSPLSPTEHLMPSSPIQLPRAPTWTEEFNSTVLLSSFCFEFVPTRIHPRSHVRYLDFSYAHDMAQSCPALLNACLACATSALGEKVQIAEATIKADRYYSKSIRALRTALQEGVCDGSEDWLLATVVVLCLYENRKPEYDPKTAAAHIAAAGQVFRKRAMTKMSAAPILPRPISSTDTLSNLVFERIFIESFLYHCMMMSVQDKNLAPLQDKMLRGIFDRYFDHCPFPTSSEPENWPIFGMHYQIIRLFSDLLAALDKLQTTRDTHEDADLEDILIQLETWQSATIEDNYGVHILLYISAAKMLAYQHLSFTSSAHEHYFILGRQELEQAVELLSKIDVAGTTFTRYFYWPLAIIDRVIQDDWASRVVQQTLNDLVQADSAGRSAYDWIAEGFERRFKAKYFGSGCG